MLGRDYKVAFRPLGEYREMLGRDSQVAFRPRGV